MELKANGYFSQPNKQEVYIRSILRLKEMQKISKNSNYTDVVLGSMIKEQLQAVNIKDEESRPHWWGSVADV